MTSQMSAARNANAASGDEPWVDALEELRGTCADQTLARSAHSFRRFCAWCHERGLEAAPADDATVASFIEAHAGQFTPRTMMLHLWGVRRVHIALGLPSPLDAEAVRLARLRHLRTCPRPRRRYIHVTPDMLERLMAETSPGMLGLRDRALLHLAFDTLCRRSELVLLRVEDLEPLPDGTARIGVRRRRRGVETVYGAAFLSRRGFDAVTIWLDAAGHRCGPILRGWGNGREGRSGMSPNTVDQRLATLAAGAGFDTGAGRSLTFHSLRVGAAQTLAAAGHSLVQVMRAGRWSSLDIPAEHLRQARANVWDRPDGDTYPAHPGGDRWRKVPIRR